MPTSFREFELCSKNHNNGDGGMSIARQNGGSRWQMLGKERGNFIALQ
jgi:hypothetical protein